MQKGQQSCDGVFTAFLITFWSVMQSCEKWNERMPLVQFLFNMIPLLSEKTKENRFNSYKDVICENHFVRCSSGNWFLWLETENSCNMNGVYFPYIRKFTKVWRALSGNQTKLKAHRHLDQQFNYHYDPSYILLWYGFLLFIGFKILSYLLQGIDRWEYKKTPQKHVA